MSIEDQGYGKAEITFRHGGSGEPLLLLHGNPMSHITWHKIVDDLKSQFYIVAADLRGYGESIGPEDGGENHLNYSFRAMANDQINLMKILGYDKFYILKRDKMSVEAEDFEVNDNATHAQIRSAFKKHSSSKKNNKTLLTNFGRTVAV